MTEESKGTYRRMLSLGNEAELPTELVLVHDHYQRLSDTMQNPFPYALHFVVVEQSGCMPALPEPLPAETPPAPEPQPAEEPEAGDLADLLSESP